MALVCLIALAGIGIGLGGGIIIPTANKKRKTAEFKIELVESKEQDSGSKKNELTIK